MEKSNVEKEEEIIGDTQQVTQEQDQKNKNTDDRLINLFYKILLLLLFVLGFYITFVTSFVGCSSNKRSMSNVFNQDVTYVAGLDGNIYRDSVKPLSKNDFIVWSSKNHINSDLNTWYPVQYKDFESGVKKLKYTYIVSDTVNHVMNIYTLTLKVIKSDTLYLIEKKSQLRNDVDPNLNNTEIKRKH